MEATEKKNGFLGRSFGTFGRWCKRHKFLSVLFLCLIAALIFILPRFLRMRKTIQSASSYEFIRTVTLQKGELSETVSCTGTVESGLTSSVSYGSANSVGSSAKVKTVHAAVGDTVQAGDIIVTLDNESILESIAEAEEELAEKIEKAKEKYEDAEDAYEDAEDAYDDAKHTRNTQRSAYQKAKESYQQASSAIQVFQNDYDTAIMAQGEAGLTYTKLQSAQKEAQSQKNEADSDLSDAQSAFSKAQAASSADPDNAELLAALTTAQEELTRAQSAASESAESLEKAKSAADNAKAVYETAIQTADEAQLALSEAKNRVSYDSLYSAYTKAESAYNSAESALSTYSSRVDSTYEAMEQALENYEDIQSGDSMEDLYEQLENCYLRAETSGKITALNVRAGDTPSGVIATIQDTDSLIISITISEADVNKVAQGMKCQITSDATEMEIFGTLTQIDPTTQSGNFGAEVTVTTQNTGLLIGMNTSVDIILSTTEDCFMVPIDAVGNDNDGMGDYIYRSTGGSGVDITFEKIYITLGETNDYYVEISSDQLSEGDVVRATADLTQGMETVDSEISSNAVMPGSIGIGGNMGGGIPGGTGGGNMGGGMPGGTGSNMGGPRGG